MQNRPQKLKMSSAEYPPKTHENGEIKEERGREITSGKSSGRRGRERGKGGGQTREKVERERAGRFETKMEEESNEEEEEELVCSVKTTSFRLNETTSFLSNRMTARSASHERHAV